MTSGFYVAVTTKRGSVWQALALKGKPGKFTVRRLGRRCTGKLSREEARDAARWARGRGWQVRVTRHPDRLFLSLSEGTAWPTNGKLVRRLNAVGRRLHRRVHIVSGWRTPRRCWELRMDYLQGRGNTAARCCTRYWGVHSWEACGKDPLSNHASGNAADCGVIGRDGEYVSIGYVGKAVAWMRRLHLCLPVGPTATNPRGEFWHTECGRWPEDWHVIL